MRIVLLLVGMLVGSVATRRASSSAAPMCVVREAEPRIVTVERPVVREVVVEREVEAFDEDIDEDIEEGDPIDMTHVFERVAAAIVPSGIHGRVSDASTASRCPARRSSLPTASVRIRRSPSRTATTTSPCPRAVTP